MVYEFNPDPLFFDRIFPFSVIFDQEELLIKQVGRSIHKLFPNILEQRFNDIFTIERPRSFGSDFKKMGTFSNQIFLVRAESDRESILLRGEMCPLNDNRMGFFCSPWLTTSDELEKFNLNIQDFALHDSVTDLLQLIKVKDTTTQDIRELNGLLTKTELRMSNLIQNMNMGILLENESRKIVLSNQLFCDIFHIPVPPMQLRGMDCSQSAEESKSMFKNPEEFVDRVSVLVEERKICLAEELVMQDGRYLERDFIPIFDGDEYMGHLWNYRDVTEKKRSREELIEARQEAEAARETEKDFITHMSHEIRTPLNSIIGMSHLLLETDLNDQQREYLEIQKSSTEILYALINDILDISKIESGHIDLSVQKVDISDVLRKQYQTFAHQLRNKDVEIFLHLESPFDEYYLTDKLLVNQILFNLLGNAMKFTEKGRIDLTAKIIEQSDSTHIIAISVKDTGIGIEPKRQQDIFQKFKQADKDISMQYGGTGLGLAIINGIVNLLGGTIVLDSKVGLGSTFKVYLPMITTHDKIEKDSEVQVHAPLAQDLENVRFLVAEDNTMNTYYIKQIMEKLGVTVDYTENGSTACRLAEQHRYDIIFMDIRMPVMDGMEATRVIRNGDGPNKGTTIIALTASTDNNQIKKARDSGFSDFVAKPFTPDQLHDKITESMSNQLAFNNESEPDPSGKLAYVDLLFGGDVDVALEMIKIFQQENYVAFQGLENHLKESEYDTSREIVHRIKPSFAMVGLQGLHQRMQDLERSCEANRTESLTIYHSIKEELETGLPEIVDLLRAATIK